MINGLTEGLSPPGPLAAPAQAESGGGGHSGSGFRRGLRLADLPAGHAICAVAVVGKREDGAIGTAVLNVVGGLAAGVAAASAGIALAGAI